jgi:N-acyl-D-amino-acid deacylase
MSIEKTNMILRRDFIKTMGLAAAGSCGLLLKGCSSKASYDLVIREGLIIDGSGAPGRIGDIAIVGERIAAVGTIPGTAAKTILSAKGLTVAPGFIDVHNHTAVELLVNPRAESAVRQGITSLVSGQCGDSPFPFSDAQFQDYRRGLMEEFGIDPDWRTIEGFYARIERGGTALNYSSFVGQGTVRAAAMGYADRKPTAPELELMKTLIVQSLKGGALGVSTGLEYAPGAFASTEELIEICRAAAPYGGIYATHMRDEEDLVVEAVKEAIRIARESGLPLQISHLKTGYPRNWPKIDAVLAAVESARASGLDIFCDRYPYIAAATGLDIYFPLWAREGKTEAFLGRLKDPALQSRLKAFVDEKEQEMGSWDKVLISGVGSAANAWVEGLNVLDASRRLKKSPYQFMRDLIVEEKDRVGMIQFIMSEDNLKRLLAHPLVGVGSDGNAVAPYGPLGKGKPHPRFYGTFPRVLGKYVREEKILSLEEMIRKMTSVPAGRFGFTGRGTLVPGSFADIVIFDRDKVRDKATWADPHQYPEGIPWVIVNGRPVVAEGEHTGALPGRILRRKDSVPE